MRVTDGAGPDKRTDDKNLDTVTIKTFPDPRGGHAAAGTEAGHSGEDLGLGCRTRKSCAMEMRRGHLVYCAR